MFEELSVLKMLSLEDYVNIGIYGTGLAGQDVLYTLSKMGMEVSFFLDGDETKTGSTFRGKKIIDICSVKENDFILIAANPKYKIHERLNHKGIANWKYVDPALLYLWSKGFDSNKIKTILKENKDKIRQVYDLLGDEKSKKVFELILRHRLSHDLSLIGNIYDENQYFGNDIIGFVNGNIVDCGAYTGDTLKRFVEQVGNEGGYHYYAFEAEKGNCDSIVRYCKENGIEDVDVFNLAVYDKKGNLSFLGDENNERIVGKIIEQPNSDRLLQADSIDNILANKKIDMITMDIEGAELHALMGAKKCISTYKPKLAVSAYHEINHLWEIPLLIRELNPEYQIYYRHYRWNMSDTVCYAI